jgi:DNA-binding CsgD family transcriptional regulator
MNDERCIGRDREVAQLDLSIGPGRDGLRLAMLSGPSGLGKTTLATVAAQRAEQRGFRVAGVRGRAGSLSTPFAPFIDAMPEFEVLLSVLAGDTNVDVEHAGIGLVNLLAELVLDQPLLLVFDDAQALDESSIALLPYVTGISERMDVSILFVEQTDAVGVPDSYRSFVDGLLARRVVGHLELGPMSEASIGELVAHELELETVDEIPGEIVQRALGNPWFAKELAQGWKAGVSEIPATIAAAATSRLLSLDEAGQDIVSAVALCVEGAHIGWLEAMSGQRPRHFVRTMEAINASGLVREDGDVYSIAHPLMQQALFDELSPAMRRAIHLELAEVIADVPLPEVVAARAQGVHLQAAGRTDEAVGHYLRAAEANEIQGQLHEAYADVVRALDAEPRMEGRVELLRRSATLAMQVDVERADERWIELGRIAAGMGDDETQAYALFQQYWTCNDGTERDRLERAIALGTDRIGWAARAAANAASLEGDYVRSEQMDRRALEIAAERGDALLETMATHRLGVTIGLLGRMGESIEVLRRAIQLAIASRHLGWAVTAWGDLAVNLGVDLRVTEAVNESRAALRYVDDLGLDRMRPATLAWSAGALMRAGDLDAAREAIDRATVAGLVAGGDHFSPLVALMRAELANELGDPQALDVVGQAIALVEQLGYASWREHLQMAEARATMRSGSIEQSLSFIADLDASSEVPIVAEVALALVRASAMTSNAAGLARGRELHALLPSDDQVAYVRLARRELDVTFAAIDGGSTEPLSALAEEWETHGRALEAMRVIAVAGALELAAGRREEAQRILKVAKDGLQGCGASADADMVASLLRQTGARSRAKSRTTNVGPLTKRELEIARLVASGLKNSEVAATLFLAEKTVAAHLSNIYGKVEVRSRVQLTAWIRENDHEFEAALAG